MMGFFDVLRRLDAAFTFTPVETEDSQSYEESYEESYEDTSYDNSYDDGNYVDNRAWCEYGPRCFHGTNCWKRHADGDFDGSNNYTPGESRPWTYKARVIFLDAFYGTPKATPRDVPAAVLLTVRTYPSCWYCFHRFGEGETRIGEHVYPLALGGSNKRRNLRASCGPCNVVKRANTFGWAWPPVTKEEWSRYNQDVRNGVRHLRGL